MAYYMCQGGSGGSSGIEYLFEDADLIANKYIDRSNGQETTYNNWSCTDYIEVTPEEEIAYATPSADNYNCYYTDQKVFISNFSLSPTGYGHITIPATAKYMRLSNTTANMQKIRLWRES